MLVSKIMGKMFLGNVREFYGSFFYYRFRGLGGKNGFLG